MQKLFKRTIRHDSLKHEPVSMRDNHRGFSIIEIVLVLLVLGLVGLAIVNVMHLTASPNGTGSDTAKQSAVNHDGQQQATPDLVPEGWKTYENERLHLSFAYPPNWTLTDIAEEAYTRTPTFSRSYDIVLTPPTSNNVGFSLHLAKDGRIIYGSQKEWQQQSVEVDGGLMSYHDIVQIDSKYEAFSYTINAQGVIVKQIKVLAPPEAQMNVVLSNAASESEISTIKAIIKTLSLP